MKIKSIFTKKQLEYIEAVIYILAVIIVIFCKVYGSIYFNFIPLLVILGVVGSLIFKRGVVTTVFGLVVSICIVYTKGNMDLLKNILYSSLIALDIAMGELLGEYLHKSYKKIKESKKRKNKFTKKTVKVYLITLGIFVLTILVNNYTNGNVIEYNICKKTLYDYLEKNYGEKENFELISSPYSVGIDSYYNFIVLDKENDDIKILKIYLKDKHKVEDEYKQVNIEKNNSNEKENIIKYLTDNNYLEKYNDLQIDVEYEKKDYIRIKINKEVEVINDENQEIFAKQIVEFLNDIKKYENYNNIKELLLSITNKNNENDIVISNIFIDGYENNLESNKEIPYLYILKSLSIEFIDSRE